MNENIQKLHEQLLYFHKLVLKVEYTGDGDIIEIALAIRNATKGDRNFSQHLRNRFNLMLLELASLDYHLTDRYYAACH